MKAETDHEARWCARSLRRSQQCLTPVSGSLPTLPGPCPGTSLGDHTSTPRPVLSAATARLRPLPTEAPGPACKAAPGCACIADEKGGARTGAVPAPGGVEGPSLPLGAAGSGPVLSRHRLGEGSSTTPAELVVASLVPDIKQFQWRLRRHDKLVHTPRTRAFPQAHHGRTQHSFREHAPERPTPLSLWGQDGGQRAGPGTTPPRRRSGELTSASPSNSRTACTAGPPGPPQPGLGAEELHVGGGAKKAGGKVSWAERRPGSIGSSTYSSTDYRLPVLTIEIKTKS